LGFFNGLGFVEQKYVRVMKTVMTVRQKVAIELGILGFLAVTFLLLFPRRNPWTDIALAGFALLGIGASARYTKNVIWAASPPLQSQNQFKDSVRVTLWITIPTAIVFFLIGGFIAYRAGGWPTVSERFLDWRILALLIGYVGWALIQQTLFQFYLLGRLLALFPKNQPFWPVLIVGLGFSLVHLPDVWTALVTAIAGPIWTLIYFRYRRLLPLALSHAVLGTAFYYGICGQNLAQEWKAALAMLTACLRHSGLHFRVTSVAAILAVSLFTSGCFIPTVLLHSKRNVAILITNIVSGEPISHMPIPLYMHYEFRTPSEVKAETDENGEAIIPMADYSWRIVLTVTRRRLTFITNWTSV
jgi:membrane protease YdiL (CAAX protease family)